MGELRPDTWLRPANIPRLGEVEGALARLRSRGFGAFRPWDGLLSTERLA